MAIRNGGSIGNGGGFVALLGDVDGPSNANTVRKLLNVALDFTGLDDGDVIEADTSSGSLLLTTTKILRQGIQVATGKAVAGVAELLLNTAAGQFIAFQINSVEKGRLTPNGNLTMGSTDDPGAVGFGLANNLGFYFRRAAAATYDVAIKRLATDIFEVGFSINQVNVNSATPLNLMTAGVQRAALHSSGGGFFNVGSNASEDSGVSGYGIGNNLSYMGRRAGSATYDSLIKKNTSDQCEVGNSTTSTILNGSTTIGSAGGSEKVRWDNSQFRNSVGERKHGITTGAATYTQLATDGVIRLTGTSQTVNLIAAATVGLGGCVFISDVNGNAGAITPITIDGSGTETINGALTQTIITAYQGVLLVSDGASSWWMGRLT